MLTHAAAEQDAAVEDVVAASPRAAALGSSVLPLVLAGSSPASRPRCSPPAPPGRAALVVAGSRARRPDGDGDHPELARRGRGRLVGERRRAQPHRRRDRGRRGRGQGDVRARRRRRDGADDGLPRQPVLRRGLGARAAPRSRSAASASSCRRARAGTCCAAPGSSTAPPPARRSPCSPRGRSRASPCSPWPACTAGAAAAPPQTRSPSRGRSFARIHGGAVMPRRVTRYRCAPISAAMPPGSSSMWIA